jgi:hypothetical protein
VDGIAAPPRCLMAKLRARGGPGANPGEVLIEIVTLGDYAKVMAIDSATGTEVSIIGPKNAHRAGLKAAALRKLDYVLNKKDAGPD